MYSSRILIYLTNFIFGVVELLLGLRIILRFFAANSATPFVSWIYDISSPLLYPFRGIFPSPVLKGGYVLEVPTLIALLAYAILGYLIVQLISFIDYSTTRYYTQDTKRKK